MNYLQIENDAIIAGLFLIILAGLFYSANSTKVIWKKLYGLVPPLLFCYLIPGFLNSYHVIHGETSGLYRFATNYLLPASLILLLSTANLKAIFGLGNKALIIFFTGSIGIIIGGPIALSAVSFFQTVLKSQPMMPDIGKAWLPSQAHGSVEVVANWH